MHKMNMKKLLETGKKARALNVEKPTPSVNYDSKLTFYLPSSKALALARGSVNTVSSLASI